MMEKQKHNKKDAVSIERGNWMETLSQTMRVNVINSMILGISLYFDKKRELSTQDDRESIVKKLFDKFTSKSIYKEIQTIYLDRIEILQRNNMELKIEDIITDHSDKNKIQVKILFKILLNFLLLNINFSIIGKIGIILLKLFFFFFKFLNK